MGTSMLLDATKKCVCARARVKERGEEGARYLKRECESDKDREKNKGEKRGLGSEGESER